MKQLFLATLLLALIQSANSQTQGEKDGQVLTEMIVSSHNDSLRLARFKSFVEQNKPSKDGFDYVKFRSLVQNLSSGSNIQNLPLSKGKIFFDYFASLDYIVRLNKMPYLKLSESIQPILSDLIYLSKIYKNNNNFYEATYLASNINKFCVIILNYQDLGGLKEFDKINRYDIEAALNSAKQINPFDAMNNLKNMAAIVNNMVDGKSVKKGKKELQEGTELAKQELQKREQLANTYSSIMASGLAVISTCVISIQDTNENYEYIISEKRKWESLLQK